MEERDETGWQKWVLGIAATVITTCMGLLLMTLVGMSSDLAVVKREVEYLSAQSIEANAFRSNIDGKVNEMRLQIQRLEDRDHTEVRR